MTPFSWLVTSKPLESLAKLLGHRLGVNSRDSPIRPAAFFRSVQSASWLPFHPRVLSASKRLVGVGLGGSRFTMLLWSPGQSWAESMATSSGCMVFFLAGRAALLQTAPPTSDVSGAVRTLKRARKGIAMSRYTGPRLRIMRRLGVSLPGLAQKEPTRQYPPGQHGPTMRRGKVSDYGMRLKETQKVRYHYGLRERQLRRDQAGHPFQARPAMRSCSSCWSGAWITSSSARDWREAIGRPDRWSITATCWSTASEPTSLRWFESR